MSDDEGYGQRVELNDKVTFREGFWSDLADGDPEVEATYREAHRRFGVFLTRIEEEMLEEKEKHDG